MDGLSLHEEFISKEEEFALLMCIQHEEWNTQLKRRTQHYGYVYDYAGKDVTPTTPIPSWCDTLVDRLIEQKILEERPNQLIVNEYVPGKGIAPHVDAPKLFGDGIVSLSLGSPIVMDFSRGATKIEKVLPRRSLLVLKGEARYQWKHGITPRLADHLIPRGTRISLTFRKVKL